MDNTKVTQTPVYPAGFDPNKKIIVNVRLKNGLIDQLLKIHDVTLKQISKEIRVSYTQLSKYHNLTLSPVNKNPVKQGLFTKTACKFAEYFHLRPEDIFPEETWRPVEEDVMEFFAEVNPSIIGRRIQRFLVADEKRMLHEVLCTLTDRERDVLLKYFGFETGEPMTLLDIGRRFNITPERVKQVRNKAIRKLRDPSRYRWLSPIYRSGCERQSQHEAAMPVQYNRRSMAYGE